MASSLTKDVFSEMIKDISAGGTLRAACRDKKIDARIFYDLIEKDPEAAQQYARATDIRADMWADLSFETAMDKDELPEHRKIVSSEIHWHIERAKPRKYGSHQTIQLDGDIRVTRTKDEVDRIVRAAAEADD